MAVTFYPRTLIGALCWSLLAAMSCQPQDDAAPVPAPLVEAVVATQLAPPDWDIYLYEQAGAAPRRLTDHPALDYNAVFSPDGRWVVFTSERSGSADLYALSLDTGDEPFRLTSHAAMDDAASFSPDGRRIAFVSARDGDPDIFVMPFVPRDGTAEGRAVNLSRRPGGDFNPAFSPDGRRIAFSSAPCLWDDEGWLCEDAELRVMSSDGNEIQVLPRTRVGVPEDVEDMVLISGSPTWSPDGSSLYYYYQYTYYRNSNTELEEEYDGGPDIRRFTFERDRDELVVSGGYSPAVGREGRIAFVRPREDDNPPAYHTGRIHSVAADGSDLRAESAALDDGLDSRFAPDVDRTTGRMVVHGPAPDPYNGLEMPGASSFASSSGIRRVELPDRTLVVQTLGGYFPALTPDGEVLSVLRIRSAVDASPGNLEDLTVPLQVSAIDGTAMRELYEPSVGIAWGAHVAREAGWVVVSVGPTFGTADTEVDVWKVRLDGSEAINLTPSSPGNDALATISSDGRRIVFRSGRDGVRVDGDGSYPPADVAVYVMDGEGGSPHRLTDSDARETMPAISPDGELVVYVSYVGRSAKLWIARVDGSERRLLEPERAEIPDLSLHPRFSPDGKWIVFTSDRGGLNDERPLTSQPQPYGDLYALPLAGGPAVRLTHSKWEEGPNDWGYLRLPARRP